MIIMKTILMLMILFPMITFGQSKENLKLANKLFKEGKFEESNSYFSNVIMDDPKNFTAYTYLGYIALLSNNSEAAEKNLLFASKLKPQNPTINWMLAELYYRENKYKEAIPYFVRIRKTSMVNKLNSLQNFKPYEVISQSFKTTIKFLTTDPLPVIQVRLSNDEIINLFIDTGGGEVILDESFLKKLNLPVYGTDKGSFAGGKKGKIYHSKLDSLVIGEFTIKNFPIQLMDISQPLKQYFKDIPISGVIGTNLLYQFISTIDYLNGQLVLKQKNQDSLISQNGQKYSLPIYLAPDHYMLAHGTINNSDSMLFFIDTGLIGGGFTCPKSTLKIANIKPDKSKQSDGTGGGGKVISIPFQINKLSLGTVEQHNLTGLYLGNFPVENAFGFRIGGLISHDYFRKYSVTFDFSRMTCYFESNK